VSLRTHPASDQCCSRHVELPQNASPCIEGNLLVIECPHLCQIGVEGNLQAANSAECGNGARLLRNASCACVSLGPVKTGLWYSLIKWRHSLNVPSDCVTHAASGQHCMKAC
jgi:hypothetical protein